MPISNPPRLQTANCAGLPAYNPCPACRQDFNTRNLLRRHLAGRSPNKRCRSAEEMWALGWWMDKHGRWRERMGHRKEEA